MHNCQLIRAEKYYIECKKTGINNKRFDDMNRCAYLYYYHHVNTYYL